MARFSGWTDATQERRRPALDTKIWKGGTDKEHEGREVFLAENLPTARCGKIGRKRKERDSVIQSFRDAVRQ